ncbi:MAG: tetratricopeptide repeat protein [Candidatus Latescibacterota bacterium]|nr:tetratricopeptide repeat protein [Candidatus Latescibacterota bacterium]
MPAAIIAYETAQAVDPDYSKAHYNLGVAYLRQQRFDEAHKALQGALSRDGDNPDVHYHLALLHAHSGDYAKATTALELVVAARPEMVDARRKLAVSYLKLGRVEDSKAQLKVVAELEGRS